jgi:hypothetical protein
MTLDQIPEYITLILSTIGALSIVVGALDAILDDLEAWADETPNKTDDKIVRGFAKGVRWTSAALGVLTAVLRPFAFRGKAKPEPKASDK